MAAEKLMNKFYEAHFVNSDFIQYKCETTIRKRSLSHNNLTMGTNSYCNFVNIKRHLVFYQNY